MIIYSIRARMARVGPDAPAWAHQMAELVSRKTGVTTEVASRVGGPQDIIWVTRYEGFAAFETAQATVQADPEYAAMLATAQEKGLFDPASVEAAIWRPV